MKRAFTLVEMLVVVVIIVILMSIVFRLGSIIGDRTKRSQTIERLHRVENCLSGYYAAFGSYPPVANYALPNPYLRYNSKELKQEMTEVGELVWANVEHACRAQPVAARFPFSSGDGGDKPNGKSYADDISRQMLEYAAKGMGKKVPWLNSGFTAYTKPNEFGGWQSADKFEDCAIFQFGLMSYLLPRYQLMGLNLDNSMIEQLGSCNQWRANNNLAANQDEGSRFADWKDQLDYKKSNRSKKHQRNLIERIPSEAVTARWLPNLDGGHVGSTYDLVFYGNTVAKTKTAFGKYSLRVENFDLEVFNYGGNKWGVLDVATVWDGWMQEIYYYSEPPYQSYRLWSAGANYKTFCPGYPMEKLKSDRDRKTAADWMSDDIIFMSH